MMQKKKKTSGIKNAQETDKQFKLRIFMDG